MGEMTKQKISSYSMKMQLYPSAQQKEAMEKIFRALHLAYNITFHQVFLKNPAVCTTPKEDGSVWPSYAKMVKKEWREFLIAENPDVAFAPAVSLQNNYGLFQLDAKRAWKTGMKNTPVIPERRREFRFYNAQKPRRSFFVQIAPHRLKPSLENKKVAQIDIPNVGTMKARGFCTKLWFGEEGQYTYAEALQAGELPRLLSVRVSKDTCGSYFVSVTFSEGAKKDRSLYLETPVAEKKEPVGIDMGISNLAILSNGQKIENRNFKREKSKHLEKISRELSRRWGPANMAYRDYNRNIRQENRTLSEEQRQPLAQPSKRYQKSRMQRARLERKIARRRDTYYHQQTAALVRNSSMIAVETLLVSNMLRNHKLAYALSDAAISDFVAKLKYKAERFGVPVCCIGTFEPSSQMCSCCGAQNRLVKNLSIRRWVCPSCGAEHDRDVNAAKNILQIAQTRGGVQDKVEKKKKTGESPPPRPKRKKGFALDPDHPELVVVFSKALTRFNDPRYVIKNSKTDKILDDAQGAGYRSVSNAQNCYKAKIKWSQKQLEKG